MTGDISPQFAHPGRGCPLLDGEVLEHLEDGGVSVAEVLAELTPAAEVHPHLDRRGRGLRQAAAAPGLRPGREHVPGGGRGCGAVPGHQKILPLRRHLHVEARHRSAGGRSSLGLRGLQHHVQLLGARQWRTRRRRPLIGRGRGRGGRRRVLIGQRGRGRRRLDDGVRDDEELPPRHVDHRLARERLGRNILLRLGDNRGLQNIIILNIQDKLENLWYSKLMQMFLF